MDERFDGYGDLRLNVQRLIRASAARLDLFDPNFKDLGLGSPELVEDLTVLLRHREGRVRLVGHDVSHLEQNCPRLLALLRHYSHRMTVHRTLESARSAQDSILIGDGRRLLRRYHINFPRGTLDLDAETEVAPWQERFEAIWDASEPAVSFTTLGL